MNKPMLVSKDFFEHLLNCLDNQKYNPTADAQEAIDKAAQFGRQLLKGAKPFNWQSDADEHEAVMGGATPQLKVPALSPIEVKVITFDQLDGEGCEQPWVAGISWVLERCSGKGSILTSVNDKTAFDLLNQKFEAIVLQSPQASFLIKGVQIVKYQSGISIEDISVDEGWEYTFSEVSGWRKEPYAVKEGDSWKLKS